MNFFSYIMGRREYIDFIQ